jgi:hypothetical protein
MRETNDCTVRALSAASGVSYATARRAMAKAGRRKNDGIPLPDTIRKQGIQGFHFEWVIDQLDAKHYYEGYTDRRGVKRFRQRHRDITLKQFCKLFRTGTYLLCKDGHALAVRNGVVIDANKSGPRTRVTHAWIVRPNFGLEILQNVR